jgi:hypothetical protein
MTGSPPAAACRAPRVRATEYTPAVLRFQCGDCATGSLEVISSSGGLLRLSKPLIRGTRVRVMFLTQRGPVLGAAEMLSPVSWTEQPFRFVALAHADQSRLRAVTGGSPEISMALVPGTSLLACSPVQTPQETVDTELQWIDKYRDAVKRSPPPRRLLKRILDAIMPGTK